MSASEASLRTRALGRWLKSLIFGALLVGAGYFFGRVCGRINEQYDLVLSLSRETLDLALWLLLGLGVVLVAAGLAASLLRPVWIAVLACALSSAAMLAGLGLGTENAVLALVYFLASVMYVRGVATELDSRVRFLVRPVAEGQSLLRTALLVVTCASFYLGYAAHIEREGFTFPPFVRERLVDTALQLMEGQLEGQALPPGAKEALLAQLRGQIEQQVEREILPPLESQVRRYESFIPIAVALALYWVLGIVVGLLAWIPGLVLNIVFPILTALRVTRVVTETREVSRLTIE